MSSTTDTPEAPDATQQTEAEPTAPDFSADDPWIKHVAERVYDTWAAQAFWQREGETNEEFAKRLETGMRQLVRDTHGYASRVRSVASHIGLLTAYLKAPEDPAVAYARCLGCQDAMFNALPFLTLEQRRSLAGTLITEGASR